MYICSFKPIIVLYTYIICSSIFHKLCRKRSEQCWWTNLNISLEVAESSKPHHVKQALAVFSSQQWRCQLYWWLWALNAHIWLLQLELRLLLKSVVAYSHSFMCLLIQIHYVDWFINSEIRHNLCEHVDSVKLLCWKCADYIHSLIFWLRLPWTFNRSILKPLSGGTWCVLSVIIICSMFTVDVRQ